MRIRNPTDLKVATIEGRIGFPGHSLTVVAKGLYRLTPGRISEILDDELAFPTGDLLRDPDDDSSSEIRYASDFPLYKPRADLLLVGSCHPPGGEAVESCRVTFRVADRERSLAVFGDRSWWADPRGARMSPVEPFHRMSLSWSRAYGGPTCPENPDGRGDQTVQSDDGSAVWPLPNVEAPEQRISTLADRPTPAGFGPLAREWEPRRSRAGTYDDNWLATRWPWYPEDLDWTLFNAAPEPMQLDGFLRGDEEVFLENLHPEHPRFETRLPGARVRCFLHVLPSDVEPPPLQAKARAEWRPPARGEMEFREVPLALDTLWIDVDAGMLALVWRGYTAVRSQDADEVLDLYLATESLEAEPAALSSHQAAFQGLLDREEEDLEGTGEAAPEVEPVESDPLEGPDETDDELMAEVDEAIAKIRAELEKLGVDPDDPPELSDQDRQAVADRFRELGLTDLAETIEEIAAEEAQEEAAPATDEPEDEPWTRERVERCYEGDGEFEGADLRGLDLSGIVLDGADLRGLDLSGAILRDASLAGAVLAAAGLREADLGGARLDGAVLAGADFGGAILSGASLEGADATGADFVRARLDETRLSEGVFDEAGFAEADLGGCVADDASFVGADLRGARLVRASFGASDLSDAVLDGADAQESSFVQSGFRGVTAVEADFRAADLEGLRAGEALDLSRANFSGASAPDSIWSGATLEGVQFSYAVLDGADFTATELSGSDFYAAHLKGTRFTKARLVDVRFYAANAFEASFKEADLTRADLRAANLYAAEFLDAHFFETASEGANLKMTKYG